MKNLAFHIITLYLTGCIYYNELMVYNKDLVVLRPSTFYYHWIDPEPPLLEIAARHPA